MILKLKPNKGLKNEVLAEQRREIEEAFRLFDHGRQGCIALKDIKIAMRALGYEPNRTEIRKFAIEKEAKGQEVVTAAEFMDLMCKRIADKDPKDGIGKAFKLFEQEGTGKVSLKSLKKASAELGGFFTEEQLQNIIEEADGDGDGFITEEEFTKLLQTSFY